MIKNIEEFIKDNDALDCLLNKKEIKLLNNFSNSNIYNEELRLQIEDAYYESFKEVFEKSINEKNQKGTVISLLRSIDYLATPKVKEQIAALESIHTTLEKAIERLDIFKATIKKGDDVEVLTYLVTDYDVLERITLMIINKLDVNDIIKDLKNKLISTSLDVCDNVANAKSSQKDDRFQIYTLIVNSLGQVKSVDASIQSRYDSHLQKASSKQTTVAVKYWVGFVFVLILFLIRLISRIV